MAACLEIKDSLGNNFFKVETMDNRALRKLDWNVQQYVSWLIDSHIHLIECHPHQGTETFGWSITDLYCELRRLKYHSG